MCCTLSNRYTAGMGHTRGGGGEGGGRGVGWANWSNLTKDVAVHLNLLITWPVIVKFINCLPEFYLNTECIQKEQLAQSTDFVLTTTQLSLVKYSCSCSFSCAWCMCCSYNIYHHHHHHHTQAHTKTWEGRGIQYSTVQYSWIALVKKYVWNDFVV